MDDQAGKGRDFSSRRRVFHLLGDFQIPPEFLEKRLNLTIGKGDLTEEGNACRSLGTVYFSKGDFRKSIEYHEKHLKIANEIPGHQKDELMQISLLITGHWVTSKKPLSIMKSI